MRPVGDVDLFLNSGAVELAIRESIDGKNVAVVLFKPTLKGKHGVGGGQLAGGVGTEAQADAIGLIGADAFFHPESIVAQTGEGLIPVFAAMEVGAVAEVDAVI